MAGKGIYRVKDWWWSKTSMLMGMVYIFALWFRIPFDGFLPLAGLSIVTICGFASMGYLVNDLFDIKKDLAAGKTNFLAHKSSIAVVLLFLLSLSFVLVPWYYLPSDRFSYILIGIELFSFLIYSIPPLRLKERGMAGVITDALYAHALPVVLAGYTFSLAAHVHASVLIFIVLFSWQLVCGVRNILIHQAEDMSADEISDSRNYVVSIGYARFLSTVIPLMIAELLLASVFFIALSVSAYVFSFFLLLIFLYSNYVYIIYKDSLPSELMAGKWKYYPNLLNEKRLPYMALGILSYHDPCFLIILVLHSLLFDLARVMGALKYAGKHTRYMLISIVRAIKPLLVYLWLFLVFICKVVIWNNLKLGINYAIYWFLKIWGVDLVKENKSVVQYLESKKSPASAKQNERTIHHKK